MRATYTYVIRRSDGTKWYIDERTSAGTSRSTALGKAKRFSSLWDAWRFVIASCDVPENWKPRRLVLVNTAQTHGRLHPGPMRHPSCLCGASGERDEGFDSYFCPKSGVWLEGTCGETNCLVCSERPKRKSLTG